jgi:spermidine synthase
MSEVRLTGDKEATGPFSPLLWGPFFVMGAVELLSQTLLLRELLVAFRGNELTIGIILANWMLAAALGAGLGGPLIAKAKAGTIAFTTAHLLNGILLPLGVAVARLLRTWAGIPVGISTGYGVVMWGSFCVLLPFGLLAGLQFAFGCKAARHLPKAGSSSATVYTLEACGVVVAGLLFAFLLSRNLRPLKLCLGVAALASASGGMFLLLQARGRALRLGALSALGTALLFVGLAVSPIPEALEHHLLRLAWPGVQVEDFYNSKYANILLVERGGEMTAFVNGVPTITVPQADVFTVEPLVQFALLMHPRPQAVLAIGTGLEVPERIAALHHVEQLHYVELDPYIAKLLWRSRADGPDTPAEGPDLFPHLADARAFLNATNQRFDVIVMNLGTPSSLQVNRLYTQEFFELCRESLGSDGILAFAFPSSATYLSEELARLDSSVLRALASVFPSVRPIPGDPAIILASPVQGAFEQGVDELIDRLRAREAETPLFNSRYLKMVLRKEKLDWFYRQLRAKGSARTNRDLYPYGTHYALLWEMGQLAPTWGDFLKELEHLRIWLFVFAPLCAISFLGMLRQLVSKRPSPSLAVSAAVLTSGTVDIAISGVLALTFQIFYGYIYSAISLLTAAFMLGLAAGALTFQRFRNGRRALWWADLQLLLAPLALCGLARLLFGLVRSPFGAAVGESCIFLLALWVGFLVGGEFATGLRLWSENGRGERGHAGLLYALDLVGACIGGVVTTAFLVPIFGIPGSCLALLLVKMLSFPQTTAYAFGKRIPTA